MTTDKFCFYLKNRLIKTSHTGGQQCSDTSPFSIPWNNHAQIIQHHNFKRLAFFGNAGVYNRKAKTAVAMHLLYLKIVLLTFSEVPSINSFLYYIKECYSMECTLKGKAQND
jgi:hypothetical protein